MKGLLLKDWYTLIKQMKIMLMLMLVFACVPGYSMAAFAVVYAAMLPVIPKRICAMDQPSFSL